MKTTPGQVLILAGAGEARGVSRALSRRGSVPFVVSHLHPPRVPWGFPVAERFGGFNGDEGFRNYVTEKEISAVLDATHPFASAISRRSRTVCEALGIPYTQILRPPWTAQLGDNWREVPDEATAAASIQSGQRVFLTTGRATLAAFAKHRGKLLCIRRIRMSPDQAEPNMPNANIVPGAGPFSIEDEVATFKKYEIDLLICRNSGGEVSRTKLDAARQLGLPVTLIARPPEPAGVLRTVSEALDWIDRL